MMFTEQGRAEIMRLVESGRAELAALVAQQGRISEQINEKRMRVDVLEELLRGSRPERSSGSRRSSGTAGLQEGSRIAQVHAYLTEVGGTQHVREILVGIGEEDSQRNRNSLSSQITRYVNDGRFFIRDESKGPRHFGLIAQNPGDDGGQKG